MGKRKCIVPNCITNFKDIDSAIVSSHRFPKDADRLKIWLINIGRPWWEPSSYDRICSLHFERRFLNYRNNRTIILRDNAIPTIFIPYVSLNPEFQEMASMYHVTLNYSKPLNSENNSVTMIPSTTGSNVWQLQGYNMRTRQGNGINTRAGAQQGAGTQSNQNDLHSASMGQNVSQQNQSMQQIGPRGAAVYQIPNYPQHDLNARHQINTVAAQSRQMAYNPMYARYPTTAPGPVFPVHPDVVFKRLPFFDHLGDLVKPSSLIPSPQTPQRVQEAQFTFHLTPAQATEIASNRDIRPNAKIDFVYQVQLRFCLLETSCEQEDCFPPGVSVKVNSKLCPLPNPIPTNKQGVEPKRPPKPVNITQLVKLSPIVMNHVQIGWASDYNKGYVIRISLVRKLTAAQLLGRLKAKGIKHADHTTGIIKEKLNEDADCEIATTSLRVSLLCPLGKFRMNVPCRASTCNHLQCFDASVYLEMNERRATWQCPVCDKPALYDNLVIDGYFQDVLTSPKLPSGESDIELHKDGSWQVHVAKKEVPIKDPNDSAVEILTDDVEVIAISSSTTSNNNKSAIPADNQSEPAKKEEKKMPVVDLTLSDSDDEDDLPLKRKATTQPRPDSSKRRNIENNGNVSSSTNSITNNGTNQRFGTPGPSSNNVSSSGLQSPSVITLLDSPSPPPRE